MDNQDITDNKFIIDLSNAKDNLEIINELCNLLEMTEAKDKNICLKLRDVELSQSQLLGIKALIDAAGAKLALIDINTEKTINSADELGIKVSTINNNLEIEENSQNTDVDNETEETEKFSTELPEFVQEEYEENKQDKLSDVPTSNELYPQQNLANSKDIPYEIFKTENMNDEKNNELPTLYLKQTLRSGQTLSYNGNILVIGDTHPGSELIAKGDITVWGVLAGIAHAGTSGDKNAIIRALKLNAIQLRIAGIYAARKNTENIPYIQRSNEFTPQEASIENGVLVIKNINNEL